MNMCTGNDKTTHWPHCVCVDTRICMSISIYLSVIWHVCICVFICVGICVYFQRWSEVYTGRDKLTECPHCGFMRGYYPSPRLQYSWNILPFVSFINSKTLLTFLQLVKSSECSVETLLQIHPAATLKLKFKTLISRLGLSGIIHILVWWM